MAHETEIERHIRYGFRQASDSADDPANQRDAELTLRYRDWKNRQCIVVLKPGLVIAGFFGRFQIKKVCRDKLCITDINGRNSVNLAHTLAMLKAGYWHLGV